MTKVYQFIMARYSTGNQEWYAVTEGGEILVVHHTYYRSAGILHTGPDGDDGDAYDKIGPVELIVLPEGEYPPAEVLAAADLHAPIKDGTSA